MTYRVIIQREGEAVGQWVADAGSLIEAEMIADALNNMARVVSAIRGALEALDPDNGNRRESDITYAREILERAIEKQ